MNFVALTGRITADLQLKSTANGTSVASFDMAVRRNEEDTDFISITAFGRQAENLCTYCGKGSKIGVCGRIQTRSFTDTEGKKRKRTEVVAQEIEFLEKREKEDTGI